MPANNQLTRRKALVFGVLFAACGIAPVLDSVGLIQLHRAPEVPAWIGVACGAVFLLAGMLLFADAAAGGADSDGSLTAGAPAYLRHIQTALGGSIVLLMALILTWIAFGRGVRHFSLTIALPFVAYRPRHPELPGRIAFGVAAVLIWLVMIMGTVAALKRHVARLRSA